MTPTDSDRLLRVDLHAHTWYSADSLNSPRRLIQRARAVGLDRIAVTDHGCIEGAFEARAIDPELVIIGEEIRSVEGIDVIGLFLRELIPNGLTVEETAARIRAQGGVVYAPHPYAYLVDPAERAARVLAVADLVEVFNSRAVYPAWNRRAATRAKELGITPAVGSDGHMPWEIGRVYNEVPEFADAPSFLAACANARAPHTELATPFIHVLSYTVEGVRALLGRHHGVPLMRGMRSPSSPRMEDGS